MGINCHFDPFVCLKAMKLMKEGLDAAGLKPFLMVQPLAYLTPDASKQGFIDSPEFPFGNYPIYTKCYSPDNMTTEFNKQTLKPSLNSSFQNDSLGATCSNPLADAEVCT